MASSPDSLLNSRIRLSGLRSVVLYGLLALAALGQTELLLLRNIDSSMSADLKKLRRLAENLSIPFRKFSEYSREFEQTEDIAVVEGASPLVDKPRGNINCEGD